VAVTGPTGRGGEVAFELSARLFDGESEERTTRTIRYLVAAARPEPFVADGQLDDWDAVTPVEIGRTPDQREFVDWGGPEDCAARWWCACDARALYFAAEVRDDRHHQPDDGRTADALWRNDSIQIGLDVAGDAQLVSNVPQYDGVNDVELGLGLAPSGPVVYAWENPRHRTGLLELADCAIVRDEQAKATRYEAAIPWPVLGAEDAPREQWMGLNVLVNDNDGEGRRGWLQWAPGIGHTKDAGQFPKVLMDARAGK
jgi:hypothetical protein